MKKGPAVFGTSMIHATDIFTYMHRNNQPNVGKYTDPMGYVSQPHSSTSCHLFTLTGIIALVLGGNVKVSIAISGDGGFNGAYDHVKQSSL